MSAPLPRLRHDLDFMPSPVEDRPGLLIRDTFRYTDAVVIIPRQFVECLTCFDGLQNELDLRAMLVRILGNLEVSAVEAQIVGALSRSGFLEDETYDRMKAERLKEFAESPVRVPSHAGSAYPDETGELRQVMDGWMHGSPEPTPGLIGIAAPHVSPEGGYESYRSAYRLLGPEYKDRTFVVLGTSHYGPPEKFGLTRKGYVTPWGASRTDAGLVDELTRKARSAVATEDYCHAVEHSIEFQVLFLQTILGPDINVLPILCGPYATSIYRGGKPEDNEDVARFLDALGEIAAREGDRLLWVLGVDMAHVGRRYGDEMDAVANENEMLSVHRRDQDRMAQMAAGSSDGFWRLVQENSDDLKWCGSSPIYTFLKAVPQARGTLRHYEQWNIDPASVVSFAGMSFHKA